MTVAGETSYATPEQRGRDLDAFADREPALVREWVQRHPRNLMALMGWAVEPFHQDAFDDALRHREVLWLAPRGSGKSTALAVFLPAWLALADPDHFEPWIGNLFPGAPRRVGPSNIRIALMSNSAEKAVSLLWQIKAILTHPRVERLFGPMDGKRWQDVAADTRLRTEQLREATFTALGLGTKVTGGHYDLVVPDDCVTEDNARTELQRRRLGDFWRVTVAPTREPWARTVACGTRYHPNDWYAELKDLADRKLWGLVRRTPALEGDPPRSYWPSMYSVQKLAEIREQIGAIAFETQYQNAVELLLGEFFERTWLEQFGRWDDLSQADRSKAVTMIALDPAIKAGPRNDFSVFAVVSYVPPYFYVRKAVRGQWTQHELVQKAQVLYDIYRPRTLGVEVVQGTEWLVDELKRTTKIPVRALLPRQFRGRDKVGRAAQVRRHFEQGRVIFEQPAPDNGISRLLEEMMAFPTADGVPGMDDCVDALVWSMLLFEGGRARLVKLHRRI